jgi:predicted RNA binding protein YcfA (HicA-like mRNA interferase family)
METALLQQLLNIAQRERIAKIPPDCTEYEAGFGLPPFEDRRSGSHFAILSRHHSATLKVATHPNADVASRMLFADIKATDLGRILREICELAMRLRQD